MYNYDAEKILLALLQFTNDQLREFINHEVVQEKLDLRLLQRLGLSLEDPQEEDS